MTKLNDQFLVQCKFGYVLFQNDGWIKFVRDPRDGTRFNTEPEAALRNRCNSTNLGKVVPVTQALADYEKTIGRVLSPTT